MKIYTALVPASGTDHIYTKLVEDGRVREYMDAMEFADLHEGDRDYVNRRDARFADNPKTAHFLAYGS